MCISEEEGFQQCLCEYLFVHVHVWSSGGVQVLGAEGGGGSGECMRCGEGGMDINHQEEHGSVAPGGDGWGVSAVMSP